MIDRTPRLHVPMLRPEDVIPHLGKGEAHWRAGYSAHALATVWFRQNGVPPAFRTVLDRHEKFRGAELVDACLERKVDLRDGIAGASQTDLLAVLGVGPELAVAAVEGKVEESFGPLVSEWRNGSQTREARLQRLRTLFGVADRDVSALRYQLFHRTASAVYEAQRYRSKSALMLVHSFSARRAGDLPLIFPRKSGRG